MLIRSGLLLAFATVLLQITVFLQPLLPEQYQVAPVCEHITHILLNPSHTQNNEHQKQSIEPHSKAEHLHAMHSSEFEEKKKSQHHHDMNHQCQYCVVYGHLIMPPDFGIKEIFIRIQIRLLAFLQSFKHVYFDLQQLFLIPQGRAPPIFTY